MNICTWYTNVKDGDFQSFPKFIDFTEHLLWIISFLVKDICEISFLWCILSKFSVSLIEIFFSWLKLGDVHVCMNISILKSVIRIKCGLGKFDYKSWWYIVKKTIMSSTWITIKTFDKLTWQACYTFTMPIMPPTGLLM